MEAVSAARPATAKPAARTARDARVNAVRPVRVRDDGSVRPRRGDPGLDPRGPLVLEIRELGRRPGSMLELDREVPAPEHLGTPLVGVPAGAPLHLVARLESVVEGVLVTADVTAPLVGECGRCLDPFEDSFEVHLQELYSYPERLIDLGGVDDDEEIPVLVGDLLDLESAVRDALVLELPLNPLCDPDCAGLTLTGEKVPRTADEPAGPLDSRWAALQALTDGQG